jgi:hypothetical protein
MFKYRKSFAICCLICSVFFAHQTAPANYRDFQTSQFLLADKFLRTELYFGTDIPGGGKVSAEDWDKFLEVEVTPRFPDGFTVLESYGQYKDSSSKIVREASRVLVLLYSKKQRGAVNTKIEEIRAAYIKQFNQESVLRLDFLKAVNVKF